MGRAAKLLLLLLLTLSTLPLDAQAQTVTGSVTATRTSGAAPLGVIFDATGTTASSGNAFADLLYQWEFSDDPNAVFATTGKLKHTAAGPLAAHLFETAGSYDVSVTITSKSGGQDVKHVTITVSDPNTVWATSNTICFSTSGTFDTGCPSSATHTTSSLLSAINSACVAGKRCLLRRGETFTGGAGSLTIGGTGPTELGAFGPSANNKPLIVHTSGQGAINVATSTTDLRVADLRVQSTNALNSQIITSGHKTVDVSVIRLENVAQTSHVGASFGTSSLEFFDEDLHDGLLFWELNFQDFGVGLGGNALFIAGKPLAVVGSTLLDTISGEHVVRMVDGEGVVISNNIIGLQSDNKASITIRQTGMDRTCVAGCGEPTRAVVISDNVIHNRGVYAIAACEANASDAPHAAECDDVLIERNFTDRQNGSSVSGTAPSDCVHVGSSNATSVRVTTRNNICIIDHYLTGSGFNGAPQDAYGNSCYSADTGTVRCVFNASTAYNNLLYAPNATSKLVTSGVTTQAGNVSATSNPFAQTTPTTPQHFQLSGAGAGVAKDTGSTTPHNRSDWNLFTRLETGTPDVGAMDESTVANSAPAPPDPIPDPPPPPPLAVLSMRAYAPPATVLFDPFTGTTGSQTLDLKQPGFAIEAVAGQTTPGSVRFSISCNNGGPSGVTGTESVAPYSQNDTLGVFQQYDDFVAGYAGQCTVTATPYSGANAGGTAGTALAVTFDVVDTTVAPTPPASSATVSGSKLSGAKVP